MFSQSRFASVLYVVPQTRVSVLLEANREMVLGLDFDLCGAVLS
jgi:hypothetical protein